MPNTHTQGAVFVVIKGSVAKAVIAANQRAVILRDISYQKISAHHSGEVRAWVDTECLPELAQWYVADRDTADYEPGCLL